MNGHANSSTVATSLPGWSTLFAQDSDQDLEFDEELEEDDFHRHKPPNRRPLVWILVLLIAVGIIYWSMKPDLAKFPGLPPSTESIDITTHTPSESDLPHEGSSSDAVATPQFGEGQQVLLSLSTSEEGSGMALTTDATGMSPGPRVAHGASLTILDGESIGQQWVYHVRTSAGQHGWIAEKHLRTKQ